MNNRSLQSIYAPVADELAAVEGALEQQITLIADHHEKLADRHAYVKAIIERLSAMRGKLLRPALVLLCGRAVDRHGPRQPLVAMAAASELVHAASLIHDDIIDGATMRREQVALYREFGTTIAVLVGDVLYAQFFALITELELPASVRVRLMQLFCAVTKSMSQGEIFQHGIKRYELEPTVDDYLTIIRSKTAALMSACCSAGALVGGGDDRQVALASDFGLQFGLMFQLVDDQMDRDALAPLEDLAIEARAQSCAGQAREALERLPAGRAHTAMSQLIEFVLGQPLAQRTAVSG